MKLAILILVRTPPLTFSASIMADMFDLGRGGEKKHRARQSGVKADKKKKKKEKKNGNISDGQKKNPRAFSVAHIVRTKKTQQRNLDRAQKKEVVPLVDRGEELPPPALVVIMGPKGCGKSTLIRSLVKIFTGQNMTDTKGPITCIAGKKRRVTLFECPLDMYSMNDLAKTADLVLLMVNASYGFSMDTFEFLNMLQLHGFPKVMGVFTHLDAFKANKTLQNTKKALKQRFWTEIYKGAKMFEFSGVINGKYLKHEVKRLSLYVSRVKFRPLVWRNTHPYVVCDRVEDVTPVSRLNENPSCKRDITMFGYVRGTHLKPSMKVHLIGVGDFDIHSIIALDDPCPLPSSKQSESQHRSSLKVKESLLYAPMANVGRVQILDKDGMYINLKNINYTKKEMLQIGEGEKDLDGKNDEGENTLDHQWGHDSSQTPMELLKSMQDMPQGYDDLIKGSELSLFKGSQGIKVFYHLLFV